MRKVEIIIHSVAESGLPDMDQLLGRVAFLHDGKIISGYPIKEYDEEYDEEEGLWESTVDSLGGVTFYDVTHWIEFPETFTKLET